MSKPIQPLRIQKGTPVSSPGKMAAASMQRPLAEISPMEQRRNSPSFNQATKNQLLDSSPFDSSPFGSKFNTSPFGSGSPLVYWQKRDPASPSRHGENRDPHDGSPSPAKRSSIENLKRASRVKNSNMFAREQKQEYDPMSTPLVERPLASGRPLNFQAQAFERKENNQQNSRLSLQSPPKSPTKLTDLILAPHKSPARGPPSPGKSSLSKNSRYAHAFDPETDMWSDDEETIAARQLPPGKSLHRHAKSVTFDVAPPQVNEYEMTTPDPSSVTSGSREGSYESEEADDDEDEFERGASYDREDSFDAALEDTEKTPVVLPEDWRFMSPETASDGLAARMDDPFHMGSNSPAPGAQPTASKDARASPTRTDSVNSNGDRRPLPPLPAPGVPLFARARSDSNNSLQMAAERVHSVQRSLPSPPRPASISKSELQGMGSGAMALEDRLRLMVLQDEEKTALAKSAAEEQRERRLRRGLSHEKVQEQNTLGLGAYQDESKNDDVAALGDSFLPPRISRESILRKVKSQRLERQQEMSAIEASIGGHQMRDIDPDTPLPSLEDGFMEDSVFVKQEEDSDSEVDVYAIPDMYRQHVASLADLAEEDAKSGPSARKDDDDESQYSIDSAGEPQIYEEAQSHSTPEDDGPSTPRAGTPLASHQSQGASSSHRMSLPQFASMLGEDDFGLSLSSYMSPRQPLEDPSKGLTETDASQSSVEALPRPSTPPLQITDFESGNFNDDDLPGTPESVIRYSLADPVTPDFPVIPEPAATIKAPGGKLKTRPSLAPADVKVMAEVRRQVSGQRHEEPSVSEHHLGRPSMVAEEDSFLQDSGSDDGVEANAVKQVKRKSSLVQLEVPVETIQDDLSMGLNKEFERVIEAQKKGYLMRQNTKMVVASSASHESNAASTDTEEPEAHVRGTRSAGNSPRKPNQSQTWTTEPWNGKTRRKSLRMSVGSPQKKAPLGPAPPLPGQVSNVTSGLDSVAENEQALEMDELEDGAERGRLFVKVVGIKDLDLPLPKGERSYFALTLDNGLHCVTTAWLELGKSAPIGQEFELVVLNDLEFQLTLQTKIEEPKLPKVVESPTKAAKVQKPSTFSRVFASPRKRKELELKAQEEAQRLAKQKQLDAQASKRAAQPTAWDLLHNLVAKDGSFARAYVCLKDHEARAYGRPYTVDLPCFNEWAMEEVRGFSNSRSSRGSALNTLQCKAPYKVGKLELQLLYIPKPQDAKEDDMPKSMNACIRELQEAQDSSNKSWEGHLSQQGGDCPYWRRRFFRLENGKLTAYHEATRQPRATINLTKASKLIDDKSSLMQKEVSGKGGSRRRSAFAAEEEGYMFVEEGFRIRFANGEVIDFYADSAAEKEGWMRVLADVVGKEAKQSKSWTDLVLKREQTRASQAQRAHEGQLKAPGAGPTPGPRQSSQMGGQSGPIHKKPVPSPIRPAQPVRPASQQALYRPSSSDAKPPPVQKDPRHMTAAERRQKTRSMVF